MKASNKYWILRLINDQCIKRSVAVNIFLVSPQLTLKVESLATLLTHGILRLLVHLVDVLAKVGVFLLTKLTFKLKS